MPGAVTIRAYEAEDSPATIEIFLRAIREVASKDYSAAEVAAWAQVEDAGAWAARRISRPAWIAEVDGRPAGFADLTGDGCIDMMFVHPDFQGLGVASLLLARVEQEARQLGLLRIHTEASLTARPFFERRGFHVLARQQVAKRGQWLTNFKMEKTLSA